MLRAVSLFAIVVAMGCSDEAAQSAGDVPPASANGAVATQGTLLDACAVLRDMDLAPFLGAAATEFKESLRSVNTGAGVTMCGASPAGGLPQLTLMLRWGPNGADPRTIEEWIQTEWAADTAD
jgi:hypothetical protein